MAGRNSEDVSFTWAWFACIVAMVLVAAGAWFSAYHAGIETQRTKEVENAVQDTNRLPTNMNKYAP